LSILGQGMKRNVISFFENFILLSGLFMLLACTSPHGLIKTPMIRLEKNNFPPLGVSIELPREPENEYSMYMFRLYESGIYLENCDCKAHLLIGMHPYWFGSLSEPQYIMHINFVRLSQDEFEKFKIGKQNFNYMICFSDYKSRFVDNIEESIYKEKDSSREFIRFHKDVALPDGDVVVCGAYLERIFEKNRSEDDDIKAIRRILNSIKPL